MLYGVHVGEDGPPVVVDKLARLLPVRKGGPGDGRAITVQLGFVYLIRIIAASRHFSVSFWVFHTWRGRHGALRSDLYGGADWGGCGWPGHARECHG